jgi:predicted O-methyltransferase YrrM
MMKRYGLAIVVLGVICVVVALAAVYSRGEGGVTDEFRRQFVKESKRSGLSTTPEDALFLRIMIEARKAKRGVEVGSATGFGAINMGVGFERTGGRLDTIDIDPNMVKACRENVAKMGLEKSVTVIEGDALKVLGPLEGEVDFTFIDAVKEDTLKYFRLLEPKMRPGAMVVVDNAIQSARAMKDFLDFMKTSPDWEMVIIQASQEKRDGMAVCYRVR